jgi:uncharacterized membrane protein
MRAVERAVNAERAPASDGVAGARAGSDAAPGSGAVALSWWERGAVGVLLLFTVAALVGYATFGLRPELLVGRPGAVAFYARSYSFFAQGQVWLAALVLALVLVRRGGVSWLWAFGAAYVISLSAELAGTTWGLPFGGYEYGPGLGPRWLDRVPVLIPVSWFLMAVPSYALARLAFPRGSVGAVAFGSVVLLAWDLSLDPAMSYATRYWTWADTGPYYGMPMLNLAGWYLTGLALMWALAALRSDRWLARVPVGFLAVYYGLNLLMPLGMSAAAGLWLAVALTVAVLGVCAGVIAARMSAGAGVMAGRDGAALEGRP